MYINDFRAGQHQRARLSPWDWRSREVADSHSRTLGPRRSRRADAVTCLERRCGCSSSDADCCSPSGRWQFSRSASSSPPALRADEPDVHNSAEYVASTLQLRRAGFRNFAMKYQTSSTPLRTAALRSSPMLAEPLTQAESKLAAEEERATLNLMQSECQLRNRRSSMSTSSQRHQGDLRRTRVKPARP
jgi:hypothetical protein